MPILTCALAGKPLTLAGYARATYDARHRGCVMKILPVLAAAEHPVGGSGRVSRPRAELSRASQSFESVSERRRGG
jgi:hypothetical protein